jgi:hypothetical protein
MALRVLTLGARCMSVVIFISQPLYLGRRAAGAHWTAGCGGHKANFKAVGKKALVNISCRRVTTSLPAEPSRHL